MSEHIPPKVLAIGLDSADPNLLLEWAANGRLPNVARLMKDGTFGRLATPDGLGDEGVWASFATSLPPAEHGRWYHRGIRPGAYDQVRIRAGDYKHPAFWHAIDAAGKRVAVIDVPKSPQVAMAHGTAVYDWRVHGIDGPTQSHPDALAERLIERFGMDSIDRPESDHFMCNMASHSPQETRTWLQSLYQSIADKSTVSKEFLDEYWDLFLVVFKEAHCAGHLCWPPGPEIKRIYEALDQAVGELLDFAGEQTTVIIFSDLGMDYNYHGNGLLDLVLRRLERCVISRWENAAIDVDILYHRARNRLGMPAKSSRHRKRWAYQVEHNELSGAVRINVRGRDPSGRVSPGKQLEEFYDYLERELLALRHPTTGRRVIDRILRTDAEQNGTARDCLPDFLVIWSREAPITTVCSTAVGTVTRTPNEDRPGNHIPGGLYVAAGPGVTSGEGSVADIMDLGVTMAALLDVAVAATSGRPIPSINKST